MVEKLITISVSLGTLIYLTTVTITLLLLVDSTPINNGSGLLCPENQLDENYDQPMFYHNETRKCYRAKTRGPCGTYMLWYQKSKDSEFGKCSCIFSKDLCLKFNRPIARSKVDNQCYPIYDQANCAEGEWFTFDENWQGICKKNPCLGSQQPEVNVTIFRRILGTPYEKKEDVPAVQIKSVPEGLHPWDVNKPFIFRDQGKCYKTFTQGPCKEGEIIIFKGTLPKPICHQAEYLIPCPYAGLAASATLNCPQNFKPIGDDCIPEGKASFD